MKTIAKIINIFGGVKNLYASSENFCSILGLYEGRDVEADSGKTLR